MKVIAQISRLLVGALFIFSGWIKANDALGFSYKLDEYFNVFGMPWMTSLSLWMAIGICVYRRPRVVISVGGYAAFPMVLAAALTS